MTSYYNIAWYSRLRCIVVYDAICLARQKAVEPLRAQAALTEGVEEAHQDLIYHI